MAACIKKADSAMCGSTFLYAMGVDRIIDYCLPHQNFEMILITGNGGIFNSA